jgi:hypothetical protein
MNHSAIATMRQNVCGRLNKRAIPFTARLTSLWLYPGSRSPVRMRQRGPVLESFEHTHDIANFPKPISHASGHGRGASCECGRQLGPEAKMGDGMIALQFSIAVMIGTLAVLVGMACTASRQAKRPNRRPVSSVEQDAEMTRSMAEIAAEMRRLGGADGNKLPARWSSSP